MKTLTGGITAILFSLLSLLVGVCTSVSAPPPAIPVGDEDFFRAEGARLVEQVDVWIGDISDPAWWQQISGWHYPVTAKSPSELLAVGKAGAEEELRRAAEWAFNGGGIYIFEVFWPTPVKSPFVSYEYAPFSYQARFTPVRNAAGKWVAPPWVVDKMTLLIGEYVYLRCPGGYKRARTRWLERSADGKAAFVDGEYPPPTVATATAAAKPQALVDWSEVVPLYSKPIIGKLTGILTLVFSDGAGGGSIVRYDTRTGAQLPGPQGEREPLMVALGETPGAVKIHVSGDFQDLSTVAFERSGNMRTWREIIDDGVGGALDTDGMRVIPPANGAEFYRARYR